LGFSSPCPWGRFCVKPILSRSLIGSCETSGTYYSTGTTLTAYQSYFTSSILPDTKNWRYEGFGIGPPGSTLDIFSNVTNEDIYLLTNANAFKNNAPYSTKQRLQSSTTQAEQFQQVLHPLPIMGSIWERPNPLPGLHWNPLPWETTFLLWPHFPRVQDLTSRGFPR